MTLSLQPIIKPFNLFALPLRERVLAWLTDKVLIMPSLENFERPAEHHGMARFNMHGLSYMAEQRWPSPKNMALAAWLTMLMGAGGFCVIYFPGKFILGWMVKVGIVSYQSLQSFEHSQAILYLICMWLVAIWLQSKTQAMLDVYHEKIKQFVEPIEVT